jgi:hypothetical protein
MEGSGLDSSSSGQCPMTNCCEHGNEQPPWSLPLHAALSISMQIQHFIHGNINTVT